MVSTDEKLEIIELLLAAGFRRIEVTSFANPKQVDSCSLSARCSGCFS
jgi:isopropylmalate/homocitrate/citramalate synthase